MCFPLARNRNALSISAAGKTVVLSGLTIPFSISLSILSLDFLIEK
jgi:hypothetical protein